MTPEKEQARLLEGVVLNGDDSCLGQDAATSVVLWAAFGSQY